MRRGLRRRYGRAAHSHEVVATRKTHDGETVQFWSDGAITLGHPFNNKLVSRDVPRDLIWIIAGDVSSYTASELPGLVKAARKALTHRTNPREGARSTTEVRRLMRAYAP